MSEKEVGEGGVFEIEKWAARSVKSFVPHKGGFADEHNSGF